jgi:hypothetical protein
MSTTSLEFTSYRPGRGPVELTIDDDEAVERLLQPERDLQRAARGAAPPLERAAGLGNAMAAVWRDRGVLDPARIAEMLPVQERRASPLRDPFDPAVGKWAAVVLRDDAARATDALEPLLALRRAEGVAFGGNSPGLVVLDRPATDRPWQWEEALRDATGDPPHHLLLVGGPRQFPFEVVSSWSARRIVGMLDVADDPLGDFSWDAVARYACKLRDHAAGAPSARQALVYAFRTDRATRKSYDQLATPFLRYLTEQTRHVPAARRPIELLGDEATTRGLLDALRRERPALVLTCTHGIEYPQHAAQWGALTGADHATAGDPLAAESLAAGEPFVEGGILFAFACFSAGIPAISALGQLVTPGEPDPEQVPHIAPLPRVALGRARGPLAFIGHVDRASTSSFGGFDGPAAFQDLADFLLGGLGTVGQGMSTFWEQALHATEHLATVLRPGAGSTPQQQVAAWIRRHDTAGWLLLGDPCVRLFPPPARAE